jgi:hypothetical protein
MTGPTVITAMHSFVCGSGSSIIEEDDSHPILRSRSRYVEVDYKKLS